MLCAMAIGKRERRRVVTLAQNVEGGTHRMNFVNILKYVNSKKRLSFLLVA